MLLKILQISQGNTCVGVSFDRVRITIFTENLHWLLPQSRLLGIFIFLKKNRWWKKNIKRKYITQGSEFLKKVIPEGIFQPYSQLLEQNIMKITNGPQWCLIYLFPLFAVSTLNLYCAFIISEATSKLALALAVRCSLQNTSDKWPI